MASTIGRRRQPCLGLALKMKDLQRYAAAWMRYSSA